MVPVIASRLLPSITIGITLMIITLVTIPEYTAMAAIQLGEQVVTPGTVPPPQAGPNQTQIQTTTKFIQDARHALEQNNTQGALNNLTLAEQALTGNKGSSAATQNQTSSSASSPAAPNQTASSASSPAAPNQTASSASSPAAPNQTASSASSPATNPVKSSGRSFIEGQAHRCDTLKGPSSGACQ
jgi:hypothetical protein